jgi:serine/threonine-protein kinase
VTPTTPRRGGPVTTSLPGEHDPREGLRRLALPLGAAAALVAVVVVAALLLKGGDDPGAGASPRTTTRPAATQSKTPTPSTGGSIGSPQTGKQGRGGPIIIDASELVGQDIEDVRAWLNKNDVTYRITRTKDDAPEGDVIDVSPTGTVELGQRVTVTVSTGPG